MTTDEIRQPLEDDASGDPVWQRISESRCGDRTRAGGVGPSLLRRKAQVNVPAITRGHAINYSVQILVNQCNEGARASVIRAIAV